MRYRITLADPNRDHWISQARTGAELSRAGFTKIKWNMGTGRKCDGASLHRWDADGDEELLVLLKLSTDVEKVEEVLTQS